MAVPGQTTQRYTERLAGNLLRLARAQRGWSQRRLAEAAGVPVSTVDARLSALTPEEHVQHAVAFEQTSQVLAEARRAATVAR